MYYVLSNMYYVISSMCYLVSKMYYVGSSVYHLVSDMYYIVSNMYYVVEFCGGQLGQPTSPPDALEPEPGKTNANPTISCPDL